MKNFINWPEPDVDYSYGQRQNDGYHPGGLGLIDTGEGGLYAIAVVRKNENEVSSRADGGCNVDVWTTLSEPDVQISGPNLWGRKSESRFDISSYPRSSEVVSASVFLGATNKSLFYQDSADSQYFAVTKDDLNDEGKILVSSLEMIGKVDILTFLDT